MDPNVLEKFMKKDQERICGFHGLSYTKKLLRHLLWITVGVIVLVLLAIVILQDVYKRQVLVGRLTKDPVLRKTANGASVVSFTVACNRLFKQEGQPEADFINTVVWNKTANSVAKYTHKGSLVGVEGRIQTRNYDDKDGKCVYVTEVVADNVCFLDSRNAGGTNSAYCLLYTSSYCLTVVFPVWYITRT